MIRCRHLWLSFARWNSVNISNLAQAKGTEYDFNGQCKEIAKSFRSSDTATRSKLLQEIAEHCGVKDEAIISAIRLYEKNPQTINELRAAVTPMHYRILQAIGNTDDGVRTVCDVRAHLLGMMKEKKTTALRRLEQSAKELLTSWFCLSNLQLVRLTWQSPGDVLHKVAKYEAVHPVRGISDLITRLGTHRRCFYFTHTALPREPLVIVHVALLPDIASNVQKIINGQKSAEDSESTAIYYSISSTQKGLAGIDLGNMLIKRVAAQLQSDVPTVKTHSTLSPIPGFRTWLLRSLRGNSEYGAIVDDFVLNRLSTLLQRKMTENDVTDFLLKMLSGTVERKNLELLKDVLMHTCAIYLHKAKHNGFALNSVANFHLRNGAVMYRLNWSGDVSSRGIENSFGIMVNYRYYLDRVAQNTAAYLQKQKISVDDNFFKFS